MTFETFYLICFLVGFLLSLVSFLMQSGHVHAGGHAHGGHFHAGHGHFHAGHGGHANAGAHAAQQQGGGALSKLNFSTITAFLAWFGGSGYLFRRYTSLWTLAALGLAALVGLVGALMVFWFLAKLVSKDRTLNPADFDMVGVLGRVSATVRPGGTGEMVFQQDGVRKAAPARSEDGCEIGRETEVVVTRYEHGIAFVRRWEEIAG